MKKHTSDPATRQLIKGFFDQYPDEAAHLFSAFSPEEVLNYLIQETPKRAAKIFAFLSPEACAILIPDMDNEFFAALLQNINPSQAARVLARLSDTVVNERLAVLPPELAKEIRELMSYPPETAGQIMDPKAWTFKPDDSVKEVLKQIRANPERRFVNILIIDATDALLGVLPLQDVAVANPSETLVNLIQEPPIAIQAMSPMEDVVQLMEEQKLLSLPIVDMENKLVGVIRYDRLISATRQDATVDLQAMFGAGKEERALSKVSLAIKKRLPWLEINLATAFLAAAVVGIFEDTIAKMTVLAVFLPVVAGQSGNTGSQALAVTMRGLALREIRTRHWLRVARKEIMVGFVNGTAVALTTSLIVLVWSGSLGLAIVIAVAMIISMSLASFSGAVIPIILQAVGQDPAQSSSIILTTVTDIVGFFSFLGLVTLLSSALNIF